MRPARSAAAISSTARAPPTAGTSGARTPSTRDTPSVPSTLPTPSTGAAASVAPARVVAPILESPSVREGPLPDPAILLSLPRPRRAGSAGGGRRGRIMLRSKRPMSRDYRCPACNGIVDHAATVCSNPVCRAELAFCSHCYDVTTYTIAEPARGRFDRGSIPPRALPAPRRKVRHVAHWRLLQRPRRVRARARSISRCARTVRVAPARSAAA